MRGNMPALMETVFAQTSSEERSFVTRQVANETLIVPVTGRMVDLESIYVLNPVAARIWELLQAPTTASAVVAALTREFAVSAAVAQADTDTFLTELAARGLIQAMPAQAPA